MDVRSSGLVHSAEGDVERLQQILRESYASGFTIFKELLQNAEDAGAKRLIVAGYEGFPDATNPLLRTPLLIVANDGPVFERNMQGITRASGGSKADEQFAVGRFGLGQKSVYHLCDAFLAIGFVEDKDNSPSLLIMNPWQGVLGANSAANEWPDITITEQQILLATLAELGLKKGMALFLPLRTQALRPGPELCLSDRNWEPDNAVANILEGPELAAALCCLRNLDVIEIVPIAGQGRKISLDNNARRLSGPGANGGDQLIEGKVAGAGYELSFSGRQQWVPKGEAARLLREDGWDKVFDIKRKLILPKADPHGAVIICRSSNNNGVGELRVRDAVYLPLGEPVLTAELGSGAHNIDLLMHGYFFVSSDRRRLRADDHIESKWNAALRREACLPLLLDALADTLPELANEPERYGLIRTLRESDWWTENRSDACQGNALARCWPGGRAESWEVRPARALRPMARADATALPRLKAAFPELETWCETREIVLAFGSALVDSELRWSDAELAELVGVAGQNAFQKGQVAETLAAMLDYTKPGSQAMAALGKIYCDAATNLGQTFANADKLAPLVRHLPREHVLILPASVDNREIIAAIASSGACLPVKLGWVSSEAANLRQLGRDEAIDLLTTLEPFLTGRGEAANQASTLVAYVLRNGPTLDALATVERARILKVIPARQMQDETEERLSLGVIADLKRAGLLFDAAPNSELSILARAVAEPKVYRVMLKDSGVTDLASAKKPECLLAVLQKAVRFDDPECCGKLAEMLRDVAGQDDLRRLIARDPHLPRDVDLIELDQFDGALDDLVDALRQGRQDRLVASALAAELKRDLRKKVGLKRLDMENLGAWLLDAHRRDALPQIDDATAVALLKSDIDQTILKVLPLHKCEGGVGLLAADALFLGRMTDVAPGLAPLARLAQLWPDQIASRVQNVLIPRWGPEAAIRTALTAEVPSRFTDEIGAALAALDKAPDADLSQLLGSVPWIAVDGAHWRPSHVLDLPVRAEQALMLLAPEQAGLLMASQLPVSLRAPLVRDRLSEVMPDRVSSYELALLVVAEAGHAGLCVDIMAGLDDLRLLARVQAEFGGEAWPLLTVALSESLPDEAIAHLAVALPRPGSLAVVRQLNALAGLIDTGSVSEAARRLFAAAFARNRVALLAPSGYLPADLLVPNAVGHFQRADALALHAQGIALGSLLDRQFAHGIGIDLAGPLTETVPPTVAPADLAKSLAQAFAPLAAHDAGDGILLALAMVGRDEAVRALAKTWQAQRSFDRICDDLDGLADDLRNMSNANQDRFAELRFVVDFREDGLACVRSAAGTDCIVPLSGRGEALLLECDPLGLERDSTGYHHVWKLVFGPIAPVDEGEAKVLLDQVVRKLAPALMLGFEPQRQAVAELLASYFASDQRTLEDTCAELKEVLHDRLRGIKPGPVIQEALRDYDRNAFRDRSGAREQLWRSALSSSGAAELLNAVRRKIGEMGYEPDRTLFELYQNAVDAQAQWSGTSHFRVEITRDANGSICRLRAIHWGRPINQPGSDRHRAENEGHERDLSNMLAISHSAKEGAAVTGRFGLGFKTVHMLADAVGLASGGIAIQILGGMIPAAWTEGAKHVAAFNKPGRKATLIDIPIGPDQQDKARQAWEAFRDATPLLSALDHHGAIELVDGDDEAIFRHDRHVLKGGISWLTLHGSRHALCFELGSGFRLLLPFGSNGPFPFPEAVHQFWHLVPLVGERRRGAWLMEGRFSVDPGRTQFSGSADEKETLFVRLGLELGNALIAFHDFCLTNWETFARETGLDPAGRSDFLRRLVGIFEDDLLTNGPEQSLHKPGLGLARLLADRPLVPLVFGGEVCASDVAWHLAGALADPSVRALIAQWPLFDEFKAGLVGRETATMLSRLHLSGGQGLNLPRLVELCTESGGIGPILANQIAGVRDESLREVMTMEEDRELRQILRDRRWLAEDGTWQPIRLLAFPQSDDSAEQARAAFAPPSNRLAIGYHGDGFTLAEFAREQAGHNEAVWQTWSQSANASPSRQAGFIRYLADAEQRTTAMLARSANWLPSVAQLAHSPLLEALTPDERGRLLAKFGFFQSTLLSVGPPAVMYQPDAQTVLMAIGDWWRENREDLRSAYARAVYPPEFSPAMLVEADAATWFTMLALASFQTLGRTRPGQSREFVAKAMQEEWWSRLARIEPDDLELRPFVGRLRAWSDPNAEDSYLQWRRCLTDLCMIARHLEAYRRLFTKLPAIIASEGNVSLHNHLRPAFSQVAARMGIEAAPLARSLGIGANWLIRELSRHGIYSHEQALRVEPYGWSTAERVRRLFHVLGLGRVEHGVDQGRILHRTVQNLIGDEARFCGDGDLPLHIITLAKHRDDLNAILAGGDVDEWPADELDDPDDEDA